MLTLAAAKSAEGPARLVPEVRRTHRALSQQLFLFSTSMRIVFAMNFYILHLATGLTYFFVSMMCG